MLKNRGFTLIELLVTVSIIAVLVVIGYSMYNNAQKNVRDARRKGDIDAIAKSYETKYDPLKNKYSALQDTDFVGGKRPRPPEDPNTDYQGFNGGFDAGTQKATKYLVCAKLESASAGTTCASNNANCYCKSSSQGGTVASDTGVSGAPVGLPGAPTSPQTFNYTGAVQTFTIPSGLTSITIEVWGAEGRAMNTAIYAYIIPGKGGYAKGTLTGLSAGEVLNIYVGGQDGWNGGGNGVGVTSNGGGASDVRRGGTALSNRIIVAGGGAGAGGDSWPVGNQSASGHGGGGTCGSNYCGGAGGGGYNFVGGNGGVTGGTSGTAFHGGGGGGGGRDSGGAGAVSNGYGTYTGGTGVLGVGGVGVANLSYSCATAGVGGGGGGYYGGGGAAGGNCGAGRGGGGSSWTGNLTSQLFTSGIKSGNGQVVLSW